MDLGNTIVINRSNIVIMATKKTKSSGYKVSYSMRTERGWQRDETTITYKTKREAQKYADQLNKGGRFKNARVKKA